MLKGNRDQEMKKKNLPHPGVVCQAKVFGEGHQHPTPDTVLENESENCVTRAPLLYFVRS